MINSPDEGKLSGTDFKVGQKVFLERRPEGLREEGDNTEINNTNDEEFIQEWYHFQIRAVENAKSILKLSRSVFS